MDINDIENNTKLVVPKMCNTNKNIIDMFKHCAACYGTKKAVEHNSYSLTYSELYEQCELIGAMLQQRGVKSNTLVGIYFDRSVDLIVAVLATLLAGGVCVPLDANFPENRLSFIINNSNLKHILTKEDVFNKLSFLNHQDREIDIIFSNVGVNFEQKFLSNNNGQYNDLMYVLYTSGSTGEPKGVVMPWGPITNLINWQIKRMAVDFSFQDRILQFSPASFDVFFWEIFTSLCSGGALILIDDEKRKNPELLLEFLIKEKITHALFPNVALQQLTRLSVGDAIPDTLKEVMVAGEQLLITPAIRSFFSKMPNCTLSNYYGPTETHVVITHTMSGNSNEWPEIVPIGRPIQYVDAFILDKHLQPVTDGDIGELYLGGSCLANGYLARLDLTSERFIQNPFGEGRLYKTSDLVRRDECGLLLYLGRTDRQVKIRGFRVELDEIEVCLAKQPDVNECAVEIQKDKFGNNHLVAYIVPKIDKQEKYSGTQSNNKDVGTCHVISTKKLESSWFDYLEKYLPEYMIPKSFTLLSQLPLTPTGKVDRKNLPSPDFQRPNLDVKFVKARTETEILLSGIWSEVLQLQDVGVNDNFFELGGSSLLLGITHLRILELIKVDIKIVELLQYPTISSLAKNIDNKMLPSPVNIPRAAKRSNPRRGLRRDLIEK